MRWSEQRLAGADLSFGHGTDNALDEAAALVLHSLGLPYELPESEWNANVDGAERTRIVNQVGRRIDERKPLAYLTQEALFAGLAFYIDERVLVPRSPIAELIEERFQPWLASEQVGRILDLCTGSACIAVGCAYAFPNAQIDAADISLDALTVAETNIKKHNLELRVRAIESDLFVNLGVQKYDLIVSNPPYVSGTDLRRLPAEYHAEPSLGFDGGETGLDCIVRILAGAADYLSDQGILITEAGCSCGTLIETFPDIPFLWLDFERGGDGVFLLTAQQTKRFQSRFKANTETRCPAIA